MTRHLDSGFGRPGPQAPRKSARISTSALVKMRRRGHQSLTVRVFDLSPEGCKLEFFEHPKLDETIWVKPRALREYKFPSANDGLIEDLIRRMDRG